MSGTWGLDRGRSVAGSWFNDGSEESRLDAGEPPRCPESIFDRADRLRPGWRNSIRDADAALDAIEPTNGMVLLEHATFDAFVAMLHAGCPSLIRETVKKGSFPWGKARVFRRQVVAFAAAQAEAA